MKIERVNNSTKPYFGTKVILSPNVIDCFPSGNTKRFIKQIKTLENNGIDDVLLLFESEYCVLNARVYRTKDERLIYSYKTVKAPVYKYINFNKASYINIIDLYKEAVKYLPENQIKDRRYGIRFGKWIDYIPGIKE